MAKINIICVNTIIELTEIKNGKYVHFHLCNQIFIVEVDWKYVKFVLPDFSIFVEHFMTFAPILTLKYNICTNGRNNTIYEN